MTESTAADTLPLFPLSSIVLFPRLKRPLYIFEPRYQQMTESALAGDRHIGMVGVLPDCLAELAGDPPIFPIGCVGLIDQWRRREDGSFDILLRGTARFEILEEFGPEDGRLFRRARVRMLDEPPPADDRARLSHLRSEVRLKTSELLTLRSPGLLASFRSPAFQNLDDDVFVNTLSLALDLAEIEKQSLLEAASTDQRYEDLLTLLHFRLTDLQRCGSSDPGPYQ